MPKPNDILPCPGVPTLRSSRRTEGKYQIRFATPFFGGGVEAGRPDETLPIRGTSIRGQLQLWWRATRGTSAATHAELFARHAEVWGTTDKASPVEIDVRDVEAKSPTPCAEYKPSGDGKLQLRWRKPFDGSDRVLPYALFPFQGQLSKDRKRIEKNPALFIEAGSFTLYVRYLEALRQDVETAIWAWVNFGGLGARTRRGCGALLCDDLAPQDVTDLQSWFRTGAGVQESLVRDWPVLPRSVFVATQAEAPIEAWKKTIALLQRFRQGVGFARNPGQQGRPGRSRYPEPETIRRVTGKRSVQHSRLQDIPDDAFPRAELGLPVAFHYQGSGEPMDTILYPATGPSDDPRERMASPLILKPLALANGTAVPLIVRLLTRPLAGVDLKQGKDSLSLPATTAIRGSRLSTYPDSPLAGSASGSALEAFLLLAGRAEHGFQQVTR